MMDFQEVSLKEQREYIYNHQCMNRDKKEQLIGEIGALKKRMEESLHETVKLKEYVQYNEIEEFYSGCASFAQKIAKIATSFGMLPAEYGVKNRNEYISRVVVEEKKVRFIRREDGLQILLPELLPHRPQYDAVDRKMKYMYDVDQWRAGYYKAFSDEFMKEKHKIFDEKVCIAFVHHVKPENKTDVDNLEYKVITDIIALFLLVDDSRHYMSHFMDMVEDDRNYTEIVVCPQRKISKYVST